MMDKSSAAMTPVARILPFLFVASFAGGCAEKVDTLEEFVEVAYRHERASEFPDAVAAYRKALELNSESATTWYDLGVAYAAMEQFPDAIDSYTRAIRLNSAMDQAYNNRAACYARLKQFERAVEDCTRAIEINPDDSLAFRNRGLVS